MLTLYPDSTYGALATYAFQNLRVHDGASIVCVGQNGGPTYDETAKGVEIRSTEDVGVWPGSTISADGQGFAETRGPGVGANGWPGQSGGGYGGDY